MPETSGLRTDGTDQSVGGISAVIESPMKTSLNEVRFPPPQGSQVRVRLEGCGICGSNLPVWEGRDWFEYPHEPGSPGHEGWGIVDALGDAATELSVGDRVAILSFNSFATHDYADAARVIRLPDSLSGQPFPGEAIGCAQNVFARSRIEPGETVCVVGVGFLGALLVQLARAAGARVIAISRRPYSLRVAERCGAEMTMPIDQEDLDRQVAEFTSNAGCQCVIEATGEQAALDVASRLVATRGRLVVAGYHQDGQRTVNMQSWNWRGIDVINAHERDPRQYVRGVREGIMSVDQGRADMSMLLTHRFPMDQMDEAFQMARERPDGFLKAWISISPDV